MPDHIHNVQDWSSWDEIPGLLPTKPLIEPYPLHDGDDSLHKAAYRGKVTECLIKTTRDINSRSHYGCTPLYPAIRADHPEAVYLLLAAGANASLKDNVESGCQPSFDALNLAAHIGAHHSLAILIDYGMAVPAIALYLSAPRNHVECLRVLIKKLGPAGFSDISKEDGVKAALERAALCWHAESVEFLLGYAPIDTQQIGVALNNALSHYDCDDQCRSPAMFGPPPENLLKVLENLIAAGADVNVQYSYTRDANTYTCSTAFWDCLHTFTVPREVIRFLIDHDLRVKEPPEELSLLSGIIGDTEDESSLVKAFIEAGADVSGTDSDLNTPLHLAAHHSFAQLLIEHGAQVCARNSKGKTPLHIACDQRLLRVAELLIRPGASVHETSTDQQWTPLMFASGENHMTEMGESWSSREELVKSLLENDADARVTAVDRLTPLHRAALSGKIRIVEQLVTSGGDVRATTTNGETALHAACSVQYSSGHAQASAIVKLLVSSGADVDAKDSNGATSLFIALSLGGLWLNADLVNLLIQRCADVRAEDKHGERAIDQIDCTTWELNESGLLQRKAVTQPNLVMEIGEYEPW